MATTLTGPRTSDVLRRLKGTLERSQLVLGELEGLLEALAVPAAELEYLRGFQARCAGEAQRAQAVLENTLEREWVHKLEVQRLGYEARIALLEQELRLLKGDKVHG